MKDLSINENLKPVLISLTALCPDMKLHFFLSFPLLQVKRNQSTQLVPKGRQSMGKEGNTVYICILHRGSHECPQTRNA